MTITLKEHRHLENGNRAQSQNPDQPYLPIGAVVAQLRPQFPGVTHSSLRFLERRGLISSTRTEGQHRLYSPREIERVRQIKRWQSQRLSLRDIGHRLATLDSLPPPQRLASEFLQLATSGDANGARSSIIEASKAGLPLSHLFGELLIPALQEVGHRWEKGDLMVAQEKEITEITRELISALTLGDGTVIKSGPPLVAACVEGEQHDLGIRMICGLLRAAGFTVRFLGADVAAEYVLQAVQLHRPVGVLLSAKLDARSKAVQRTIELLKSGAGDEAPVIVGGQITLTRAVAVESWGAIPVTAQQLDDAISAITGIVGSAFPESRPDLDG
ncbi:MAG: cobalamin-dependent protein, partial [Thermomicrobiales bacterium]